MAQSNETASREDSFTTISLAKLKAQGGLWKTNICPLACLSALPHQGGLSIQMSCVFTSATLAPRAALHTLGWAQQKVTCSCCTGTLHSST